MSERNVEVEAMSELQDETIAEIKRRIKNAAQNVTCCERDVRVHERYLLGARNVYHDIIAELKEEHPELFGEALFTITPAVGDDYDSDEDRMPSEVHADTDDGETVGEFDPNA